MFVIIIFHGSPGNGRGGQAFPLLARTRIHTERAVLVDATGATMRHGLGCE